MKTLKVEEVYLMDAALHRRGLQQPPAPLGTHIPQPRHVRTGACPADGQIRSLTRGCTPIPGQQFAAIWHSLWRNLRWATDVETLKRELYAEYKRNSGAQFRRPRVRAYCVKNESQQLANAGRPPL